MLVLIIILSVDLYLNYWLLFFLHGMGSLENSIFILPCTFPAIFLNSFWFQMEVLYHYIQNFLMMDFL